MCRQEILPYMLPNDGIQAHFPLIKAIRVICHKALASKLLIPASILTKRKMHQKSSSLHWCEFPTQELLLRFACQFSQTPWCGSTHFFWWHLCEYTISGLMIRLEADTPVPWPERELLLIDLPIGEYPSGRPSYYLAIADQIGA